MHQNPFFQIKRDIQMLESNIDSDPNVMKLKITKHRKSNSIFDIDERIKHETVSQNNQLKQRAYDSINRNQQQKLDTQLEKAQIQYGKTLKECSQLNQTYNRVYKECQQSIKKLSRDLSQKKVFQKINDGNESQKIYALKRHINVLQAQNQQICIQKAMLVNKLGQAMKLMQKYEIIINRNEAQVGNTVNQQIAQQNQVLWIKIQDYQTRLQQIIKKVERMETSNVIQKNFTNQFDDNDKQNFTIELKKQNKRYLESLNCFHQSMKHFENKFARHLQSSESNISQVIQVRRAALEVQQSVNRILENNQRSMKQYNHLKQKNKQLTHKVKIGTKSNDQTEKKLVQKIHGYDKLVKKLSDQLEKAIMYNYNFNIKRQKLGAHVQNKGKQNLEQRQLINSFKELQYKMYNINQQIDNLSKNTNSKQHEATQKLVKQQLQHYRSKCKILQEKVLQLQKSNLQYQLIPTSKKNQEVLRKQVLAKSQQIIANQSQIKRLKELLQQKSRKILALDNNIPQTIIANSNFARESSELQVKQRQLQYKYQQACDYLQKCQSCLIQRQQKISLITQQYDCLDKLYEKALKQLKQLRSQKQISLSKNKFQAAVGQKGLKDSNVDFLKGKQLSQQTIKKYRGNSTDIIAKLEIQVEYKQDLMIQFQKQLESQQHLLTQYLTNRFENYDSEDVQMSKQRIFILTSKIESEKEHIMILRYKIKQLQFYQSQFQQKHYCNNPIMNSSVQQLIDHIKLLQHKLYQANRLNSEMHMSRITREVQHDSIQKNALDKIIEDYQYTKKNLNVYRNKSLLQEQVIENLKKEVKNLKGYPQIKDTAEYEQQAILKKVQVLKAKKGADFSQKVQFMLTPKDLQDRLMIFQQRQDSKQSLKNNNSKPVVVETQSKEELCLASQNKVSSQFYLLSASSEHSNYNSLNLLSTGLLKNNDSKESIYEQKQGINDSNKATIKIQQNDDSLENSIQK